MSAVQLRRRAAVIVGAASLAACAARTHEADVTPGGTQLVATNEPLAVIGPVLPPQPVHSAGGSPLLAVMTRMVANDGAWRPLAWKGVPLPGSGLCPGSVQSYGGSAVAAPDPRAPLSVLYWARPLGSAGLSLVASTGRLGAWNPCSGGFRLADATTRYALPSRVGLLAPDVTGRDTSLLFTTDRAAPQRNGAGLVDAVVEQFVPARRRTEGRTAAPRGARTLGSGARPQRER